jgi:DNA-binding YbaB/EbfC family protein
MVGGALQQLQRVQQGVVEAQEALAAATFSASVGGGAVTAVVTGERRVQSLAIEPEVVDPEDVEMLQDLVVAAVNEGLRQVDQALMERVGALTSGLGIPGLG